MISITTSAHDIHLILDLIPAAVYICDADGHIVHYNRTAVELWGSEPQDSPTVARFCGAYKILTGAGEYLPHDRCPMAEVLQSGTSIQGAEVIIERPDGSKVWVRVNISPIRDEVGRITGAVNCFTDTRANCSLKQREKMNSSPPSATIFVRR
jgi:PAS domain-containing protein